MLRVGLTGGIGSGKSTVARLLADRGAVLVDADQVAREVVAAGSPGLAEIVERFGPEFLGVDGELDRPRMAAAVFADDGARARLNAIVHPLIRTRSAELAAAAPADAVVVQDVPLLVEGHMGSGYALVVVVHAAAQERVRRLVGSRGMAEDDAWARIRAQASDEARRAAADVWLDNGGAAGELEARVDGLWSARLVPFRDHLGRGEPAPLPETVVAPDPAWPAAGARLAARVAAAAGEQSGGVEHVGPTAVPGLAAADVIDLQLALTDAGPVAGGLAAAGFVEVGGAGESGAGESGSGESGAGESGAGRYGWRSADPGRPARLAVLAPGSAGWRHGLLVRDRLRDDAGARASFAAAARTLAGADHWLAAAQPAVRTRPDEGATVPRLADPSGDRTV